MKKIPNWADLKLGVCHKCGEGYLTDEVEKKPLCPDCEPKKKK